MKEFTLAPFSAKPLRGEIGPRCEGFDHREVTMQNKYSVSGAKSAPGFLYSLKNPGADVVPLASNAFCAFFLVKKSVTPLGN